MPEHKDLRRASAFEDESLLDLHNSALRAYGAALNAFNSGNWDGAIIACGKAMEEVAKVQLPYNERNGALAQLLERLPRHLKLEQPVTELAAAIKDPKGLGGHFDLDRRTNEEIARATLSLVESYINYVYLFKAKVDHLVALVERTEAGEADEPEALDMVGASAPNVVPDVGPNVVPDVEPKAADDAVGGGESGRKEAEPKAFADRRPRPPLVSDDDDEEESPFDAFNKRDPYDIRSTHWNIGEKDD